jgi:uncharacterized protein YigA (DUF484 family)
MFLQRGDREIASFASLGGVLADRAKIWDQMNALMRISQSISSSLSLDEVLRMIVENAARTLGMKGASLRLLDEERKTLKVRAAFGLSKAYLGKGPYGGRKSFIDQNA